MRSSLPKPKISAYRPKSHQKRLFFSRKISIPKNLIISTRFSTERYQQILFSYLGSFIGISALAYLSGATHFPLIMAPFGATSVLCFAVPDSPLAQPRNIIGGNCIAAFVSLICLHLFGSEPWVMALAVATAIGMMQLTKTLHPPAGAVALVAIMNSASWGFFFTPVLMGSLILVFCSVIFNNLVPGRIYPKQWL